MYVNKIYSFDMNNSIKQLKKIDPDLIKLFDYFMVDDLSPEENYFKALTRSIIYQQLSGKAAKTILDRFIHIFPDYSYPTPEAVINTDIDILCSAGLSNNKAQYIKNIARAFIDDSDKHYNLGSKTDQEVIDILTKIKGVGLWTAQMFMMFTLNRPDVFPATDLAIQKGYQNYFNLDDLPKPDQMLERSELWRPHRTTVSLFLWAVLEGPFEW